MLKKKVGRFLDSNEDPYLTTSTMESKSFFFSWLKWRLQAKSSVFELDDFLKEWFHLYLEQKISRFPNLHLMWQIAWFY